MSTPATKPDYFRLACLFLAPQVPQPKSVTQIDEEEEREIAKWLNENPQPSAALTGIESMAVEAFEESHAADVRQTLLDYLDSLTGLNLVAVRR